MAAAIENMITCFHNPAELMQLPYWIIGVGVPLASVLVAEPEVEHAWRSFAGNKPQSHGTGETVCSPKICN